MSTISLANRPDAGAYLPSPEEIDAATLQIREQHAIKREQREAAEESAAVERREMARLKMRQRRRAERDARVKVVAAGPAVRVVFEGPPREMERADIANVEPVTARELLDLIDEGFFQAIPLTHALDSLEAWAPVYSPGPNAPAEYKPPFKSARDLRPLGSALK